MEGGSLLQQALGLNNSNGHAEEDLKNTLGLDVHLLQSNDPSSPKHLIQLAQLACHLNAFYQAHKILWHMGGDGPVFGLHLSGNGSPHLRAICCYGANVSDEWMAIGLLMQFSSQNSTNFVAEFWDMDDGQILLIESAHVLPEWVDRIGPEACRHRCWLYHGRIYLLEPKNIGSAKNVDDQNHHLDLEPALQLWQEHAHKQSSPSLSCSQTSSIVASPQAMQDAIEQCILDRVLGLDAKGKNQNPLFKDMTLQSTLHKATLTVPRSVASLIRQRPDLVNAATVAFANLAQNPTNHQRDAPQILCEDWVWTTHAFARTNYAMLRTIVTPTWNSEEYIPKTYSQSLEVRRLKRQCAVEATPHLRHALQLGVRLVTGFQCLLSQQLPRIPRPVVPTPSDATERRLLQFWPKFLQKMASTHRHEQSASDETDSSTWLLEAWRAGPQNARYNLEPILRCPLFQYEIMPSDDMQQPQHAYSWNLTPLSNPDTPLQKQIQRELTKAKLNPLPDGEFVMPRPQDVDNENWMVLPTDLADTTGTTRVGKPESQVKANDPINQLDTMMDSFQTFMVDQSGIEGVSHTIREGGARTDETTAKSNDEKEPVTLDPRAFLFLLKSALAPSKSAKDISLLMNRLQATNTGHTDPFFSNDDYDALDPDDEEGDDEEARELDTDAAELMAAMDEELRATAAGATEESSGFSGDHDEDSSVAEHARVLTNLLQSLDAGGSGPGPVPNMLKAMGKKPPLITVVDDDHADGGDDVDLKDTMSN